MDAGTLEWRLYSCQISSFGLELRESSPRMLYWLRKLFPETVSRILSLTGFLMVCDTLTERNMLRVSEIWGSHIPCRFPLFSCLIMPSVPVCYVLHAVLLLSSLSILAGIWLKLSTSLYCVTYWYLYLQDTSLWNNHSYLFGLLALLFAFMTVTAKHSGTTEVPIWNYRILRFQIFVVYFYAGIKKFDGDWTAGHSVTDLSNHEIFAPLRLAFSTSVLDHYFVHWGGLAYDLSVGFLLLCDRTRHVGCLLSLLFHGMNATMFRIGMFPYVMLAMTPVFFAPTWPKELKSAFESWKYSRILKQDEHAETAHTNDVPTSWNPKTVTISTVLMAFVAVQLLLPFASCVTKGLNTWTGELYGYSWDMMVQQWQAHHVRIAAEYPNGERRFLKPDVWTINDRWTNHGRMAKQLAVCLAVKLSKKKGKPKIYFDVWMAVNRGFKQRIFRPDVDVSTAHWSLFEKPDWVLPLLLNRADHERMTRETTLQKQALNPNVTLTYIVDYPGYTLRQFVPDTITNVTLEVLRGTVGVTVVQDTALPEDTACHMFTSNGTATALPKNTFVDVKVDADKPAVYLLSYS